MNSLAVELDVRMPELVSLLGEQLRLEIIADGLLFTEGPVWLADEHALLFTDIAGDHIHRWSERDGATIFRAPSHMANGLATDEAGRLVICEHATSRVTRLDLSEPAAPVEILADRYAQKQLNSPNDVIVARDGTIFFTDPNYGREPFWGVPRSQELDFQGVYSVDPGNGALTLLADDFIAPNGLCLSADEAFLFVNDSEAGTIRRFRKTEQGKLVDDKEWARLEEIGEGSPDGMKLDRFGNLFCCGPGGIHIFRPDARCLGIIRMPEFAANLTFGGDDLNELFITATSSVYRLRVATSAAAMEAAKR